MSSDKKMMPFPWNGEDIGYLKPVQIRRRYDSPERYTQWGFQVWEFMSGSIVFSKKIKTTLPALADEIKPLFGLPKNGTHTAMYQGDLYFLIRAFRHGAGVVFEPFLDQIEVDSEARDEFDWLIRFTMVYREILNICGPHEKAILMRTIDERIFPVSFYEPNINVTSPHENIPHRIQERYFNEISMKQAAQKLFEVTDLDSALQKIGEFQFALERTIERIDKKYVWMTTIITERLTSLLTDFDQSSIEADGD